MKSEYVRGLTNLWCNEFPGDYTGEVTPDPFPNSEAKLVGPMVVLRGESRYRQEL